MGYFRQIYDTAKSIAIGMGITFRYLVKPSEVVTMQYPHVRPEIPERHRGLHFLETEKCIMCELCAKACPVECIYIEGTKDYEEAKELGYEPWGYHGDRAVITRFAIDYSKCIFCHLCVDPCPKDCILMGAEYDLAGYTPQGMTLNLLTGRTETAPNWQRIKGLGREGIHKSEELKKKKKEEAKRAKAAAQASAPASAPPASSLQPPASDKRSDPS